MSCGAAFITRPLITEGPFVFHSMFSALLCTIIRLTKINGTKRPAHQDLTKRVSLKNSIYYYEYYRLRIGGPIIYHFVHEKPENILSSVISKIKISDVNRRIGRIKCQSSKKCSPYKYARVSLPIFDVNNRELDKNMQK